MHAKQSQLLNSICKPARLYTVSLTSATNRSPPISLRMASDAVKRFFSSPNFAVAGASQDTKKFGYKREWKATFDRRCYIPASILLSEISPLAMPKSACRAFRLDFLSD